MSDDHDIFVNVRHEGKLGEVLLTDQKVIFQESKNKKSLRSSRSQWPLDAVKESTIKPVTRTVDVMFESGDGIKELISFQLTTLQEAMHLRKRLANRFHDGKSSVVSVSKDGTTKYLKEKVTPENEDKETTTDEGRKSTRPPSRNAVEVDVDDLIESRESQTNRIATGSDETKSTSVQVSTTTQEATEAAPEDARRRRTSKLIQRPGGAQPKSLTRLQQKAVVEPEHLVGLDDSQEGAIESSSYAHARGLSRRRESRDRRSIHQQAAMALQAVALTTTDEGTSSTNFSGGKRNPSSCYQSMTDEEAAKRRMMRAAIQMQNDLLSLKQAHKPASGSERNEEKLEPKDEDSHNTQDLEEPEHTIPGGHQARFKSVVNMVEARVVEETPAELQGLPAIASEIDLEREEQPKERPQRKLVSIAVVGGCAILIVVAIVAILFATNKKEDATTPGPMSTEDNSAIVRGGIQNVVFDEQILHDPSSPQSKAFHWLTMEDTLHQSLVKIDARLQEKLEQRYTLAVFYFSQVNRWEYCRKSETGESAACIGPVLESYPHEGVFYNQKMSEPAYRWLSEVDECRWAGVKCTDGVHVSKLQLAGYQLQSTLPIEIGFLRSLQVLDLQQNSLFGSLPAAWGQLESQNTVLQNIRLDQNELTGPIPEEWCQLSKSSLKSLILSNNRLSGTIPTCLSQFSSLENFSIMNNLLTGTVPTNFGLLIHLHTFHVAGNDLTGSIPDEVCNLERYRMTEASADCNDALSENYVHCSCCSTCCDGGNKDDCNLMHPVTGRAGVP